MSTKINGEIFREDAQEKNDVRFVTYLSPELVEYVEQWKEKHSVRTKSAALRLILRCCRKHAEFCDNTCDEEARG